MEEWLRNNKFRLIFNSLIVSNILIWSFFFTLPDAKLHLKIYDVGQGDAIFLRTAGDFRILVDGGPSNKVLEYLGTDLPFYSKSIDLVILTHPQADHLTGLVEAVKRYNIKSLWVSDAKNETRIFSKWQAVLQESEIDPVVVNQGDKLILPDGTEIRVLSPRKEGMNQDVNSASVVVLVSYGNFDALLTGDADQHSQPYTGNEGHVEVFKVPHHGAKESIDQNFVATLSPEVSVISVGANNKYGHPSQNVISFLENLGSKVYRTDKNGTTEIVSDGKSWYTRTSSKF
ncbi:MAG: hypothetical protein A2Z24_02365 [Candidatus Woykebacteria bacterium RBG_16_44_10]|uniref:Metallo-beta-lactamase domain-containing protein n=1 Tax=Candidatus Woykebacteria bacterium RBG_16_44_10 TaxID=1802597 RepID=A0A1G1WDX7_9BACT|nr:MAG: hypothetical protein A2Z24_02365 [Candidatus Woykebacteria bacterium RBG_16_44_10]